MIRRYRAVLRAAAGCSAAMGLLWTAHAPVQAAASLPPTISKVFSPSTTGTYAVSRLTFTITNPNTAAGDTLFNIQFQDSYPAGLANATPPNITNSCGGNTTTDIFGGAAGGTAIGLQGGNNDLPRNTSCQVGVDVVSATPSAYNNVSGAVTGCRNNACPASQLLTGNTAAATLTVEPPSLTMVKSSAAYSDPFNLIANPKRIPGGFVNYSVVTANSGLGTADSNTAIVTDPIPANTDLFVGDLGGPGSGPVAFSDGALSSGLSYTFTSLASTADDVSFSSDGGATFAYTPVPDGNGVDPAVTHIRINPKGAFAGDATAGSPSPNFTLSFRVRIE